MTAKAKAKIEAILKEHGIAIGTALSGMRRNSMACVALPTCGLALAESERFLPELHDGARGVCSTRRASRTTRSSSA